MGEIRMIDVGDKPVTRRRAVARSRVRLAAEVAEAVRGGTLPKGDALAVCRVAAIMAAKRTPDLLPLCHPLPLTHVAVAAAVHDDPPHAIFEVECETTAQTGVEMEAMCAAAAAALCLYDMTKGVDASATIESVELVEKSGGKSGRWVRPE